MSTFLQFSKFLCFLPSRTHNSLIEIKRNDAIRSDIDMIICAMNSHFCTHLADTWHEHRVCRVLPLSIDTSSVGWTSLKHECQNMCHSEFSFVCQSKKEKKWPKKMVFIATLTKNKNQITRKKKKRQRVKHLSEWANEQVPVRNAIARNEFMLVFSLCIWFSCLFHWFHCTWHWH